MNQRPQLALPHPGHPFPQLSEAWPAHSAAPGLIAAGGVLDVPTLVAAYSATIFPWFSKGEPTLWWSPDPRMVLQVDRFRLHRSLRRVLQAFRLNANCEIRIDTAFDTVIAACAAATRPAQTGTWIGPEMQAAYRALHRAGHAHSVETWVGGRLVAGLYCVAIGRAVFGESMFTHVTDGSKIALSALVALPFAWFAQIARQPLLRRLDTLADAPFVVPGTVLALAMILVFLPPLPGLGVSVYGTPAILLFAYLARFLVLGLRPIISGYLQLDRTLEEAAQIAGAGLVRRLVTIIFPLVAPAAVGVGVIYGLYGLAQGALGALAFGLPRDRG